MEVRDANAQSRIGQIADLLLMPHANGMSTAAPLGTNASGTAGNATGTTSAGTKTGTNTTGTNNTSTNTTGTNTTGTNTTGTNAIGNANIGNTTVPGATGAASNPALGTGNFANSGLGMMSSDIRFALIQVDNASSGRLVVVPWQLLTFQGTFFVLGLDQSRLSQAPSVMQNDPRLLQSDQWLNQVGTFFANDLQGLQGQAGSTGTTGTTGINGTTGTGTGTGAATPNAPATRTTQPGNRTRQ